MWTINCQLDMKHYYQHLTLISELSTTTTLLHLLVVIVV